MSSHVDNLRLALKFVMKRAERAESRVRWLEDGEIRALRQRAERAEATLARVQELWDELSDSQCLLVEDGTEETYEEIQRLLEGGKS